MKRAIFLAIIFTLLLVPCLAKEDNPLFVVTVNGKKGFIDKSGRVVVEPRFADAVDFSDGLAAVMNDEKKWGYIDKTGVFVIEPKFGAGYSFADGVAVNILNDSFDRARNEWILLYKNGQFAALPDIKDIADKFSEGLIAAKNAEGKWGYINKNAEVVVPFKFNRAMPFVEGLASVLFGGAYGYINPAGEFVINPFFNEAYNFSEGLAYAKVGGQLIKTGEFETIDVFEERMAKRVLIDKTGKIVVKLASKIIWVGKFIDGLAEAQIRDKKNRLFFGFVDKSGKFVIKPEFIETQSFSDGLALVVLNESVTKFGFVDKSGKIVFESDGTLKSFRNGLAAIQEGATGIDFDSTHKYGYIDKKGKFIWQPTK